MSNGKGDTPRPSAVSAREYAERWEWTFGRLFAGEPVDRVEVAKPYGIIVRAHDTVKERDT